MTSVSAFACLLVLYLVYRRFPKRISISQVRGPPCSSWLFGNWIEFLQAPAGELDFRCSEQFGGIVRINAPLGFLGRPPHDHGSEGHSICLSHGELPIPKLTGRSAIIRSLFGPGLTVMEGHDHKRARKIMLPGFGGPESRSFLPVFIGAAGKLAQKWQDLIASDAQQMTVVSIPWWISRATLDAIGEAAFDYHFGALDNTGNALADMYTNLFFDVFGLPTKSSILSLGIADEIPPSVVNFLFRYFPPRRMAHIFETNKLSVARKLVEDKTAALWKAEVAGTYFLSWANHSEKMETGLEEKEVLAQMNTIILAGHETTANSLTFALFELYKQPEIQKRLRAEIRGMGKTSDYTASDFDNMLYLTAVVKETLVHSIFCNTFRVAGGDEVLPLLNPLTLDTGEVLTELPIPKGTKIITSIAAYNRHKAIFGEDADVLNPDQQGFFGVYGNMYEPR
ncbi:cytochrome P450 [Mucidula mucida]|nr:cytochrome P450 [Mucidula mucida]